MCPYVLQVEESMNVFEYSHALKWCYKGLNKYPNSQLILETSGNVLLENGQTEDAIKISFIYHCTTVH